MTNNEIDEILVMLATNPWDQPDYLEMSWAIKATVDRDARQ